MGRYQNIELCYLTLLNIAHKKSPAKKPGFCFSDVFISSLKTLPLPVDAYCIRNS